MFGYLRAKCPDSGGFPPKLSLLFPAMTVSREAKILKLLPLPRVQRNRVLKTLFNNGEGIGDISQRFLRIAPGKELAGVSASTHRFHRVKPIPAADTRSTQLPAETLSPSVDMNNNTLGSPFPLSCSKALHVKPVPRLGLKTIPTSNSTGRGINSIHHLCDRSKWTMHSHDRTLQRWADATAHNPALESS